MAICKPCKCCVADGILAVFYVIALLSAAALLIVLFLDQSMNNSQCKIFGFNLTNGFSYENRFHYLSEGVCVYLEYVTGFMGFLTLSFMFCNWFLGCNSLTCWWVVQLIFATLSTVLSLMIGVVITTVLLIFCSQMFNSTGHQNCFVAVDAYSSKYKDSRSPLIFEHMLVVAVSAWMMFLSWLIASFVLLLHSCINHYQRKQESLERLAANLEVQSHRERERYSYLINEAPPSYVDTMEDQPLIEL